MEYEWAVRVTMQYLDDDGNPDGDPMVEVRPEASGERAARARIAHMESLIASGRHPRWGKAVGVKLLQRPISPWVEVD